MADEKKIATVKTPDAKSAVETSAAEKKTTATKTTATKATAAEKKATAAKATAAEKKATAAKTTAGEKKTTAKKTAAAKKTTERKTNAKKAPVKKSSAKKEITLDDVTTALWNKIEKADVSKIEGVIAIQVFIDNNVGTFFICVKDGEKHIIQAVYDDRDGTVCCSVNDALSIAKGGFDFLAAIKSGAVRYQGDLGKALVIKNLFN